MSFYTSLSGLKGAQTDLSVTSNNIANIGAVGFKKSRTEFGDLVSASPLQAATMAGQGTRLKSITQEFTQGGFRSTERTLDLAISGEGFFVTESGGIDGRIALTRNGSFDLNEDRMVVDTRGASLKVMPVDVNGDPTSTALGDLIDLVIPQANAANRQLDSLAIDSRGLVSATYADGTTDMLGRIAVANVANPGGLRQLGDASFGVTGKSGDIVIKEPSTDGSGFVQSGALEQANVDITEELVALIAAQRNFQANAKAIETANTMTDSIVNLR